MNSKIIKDFYKNIAVAISFFLISVIYVEIFLKRGIIIPGDDRGFNIERLEEAYMNFKSGHLFSAISTFSASRIGQAIGTYYPSGNLIIYAIIRTIIHKPLTSYYIYTMVGKFLGLAIAYISCKYVLNRRDTAYVFSILYSLAPYIMSNDYVRFDIGESWAAIFFPMIFAGMYLVMFSMERKKLRGVLMLTLGLAFVTYSHVLSAVMSILILLLLYLFTLKFQKDKIENIKLLVISAVLYFISVAGFIVPFVKSMLSNNINTPGIDSFGTTGMLDMSGLVNESIKNSLSFNKPNMGIILIIIVFVGMSSVFSGKIFDKFIYTCGIVLLICSTSIIPWNLLAKTPIEIIQYPWRLLSFSILFLSLYAAIIICNNRVKSLKFLVVACSVLFSMSTLIQCRNYGDSISNYDAAGPLGHLKIDSSNYRNAVSINRDINLSATHRDYLPENSLGKSADMFVHNAYVNDKKYFLSRNKIISGYQSETFKLENITRKRAKVVIPFVIYNEKDYKVTINGSRIKVKKDNSSRLSFQKPADISNMKIKIEYITPKYVKIIRAVSLGVILLLCIGFIFNEFSIIKGYSVKYD